MALPKNLMKRGNVFYGRVAVPKPLRDLRDAADQAKSRREVTRSLGTSDRKEADQLLPAFLVAVQAEFADEVSRLRSAGVTNPREPTADDLKQVRHEFFRQTVIDDTNERNARKSYAEVEAMRQQLRAVAAASPQKSGLEILTMPGYLELATAVNAAAWSTEKRKYLIEALREHLTQSNYVLVAGILEGMVQEKGLVVQRDSLTYKSLARGMMEEWLRALQVADLRDKAVPDDPALTAEIETGERAVVIGRSDVVALETPRAGRPARGRALRDRFDAYLAEQKAMLKPNDLQAHRATIRQFIECNGDKEITGYGRSDMATFKKGLQQYPANAARLFPDTPFKKVIELNRLAGHSTLNSNTVRSKLSILSGFGKWLEANDDDVDAASFRTTLPKRSDRQRMAPFDLDDVKKILNSYAFIGSESAKSYQKPGSFKLRGWHFWLTLIAAFTGARVNEIVQMKVTDLRQVGGVWAFDITDEGEDQSLKTGSSKRLLPVHPRLIELGLLNYRDTLLAVGSQSLFEDAPIGKNGRRSEAASRWFRRFLQKIGVKGENDLGGSHRWRHTIADALRRAHVETADISMILGHQASGSRQTRHYGREMDMALTRRLEILSKAEYPGVDFDLLK